MMYKKISYPVEEFNSVFFGKGTVDFIFSRRDALWFMVVFGFLFQTVPSQKLSVDLLCVFLYQENTR